MLGRDFEPADFEVLDGVKSAHRIASPYKLASRSFRPNGTVVRIGAAMLRRALAEQVDIADILIEAFRERRDVIRGAAGNALELVGRPDAAATLDLRTYVTQLLLPHSWFDAGSPSGRSERATSRAACSGSAAAP